MTVQEALQNINIVVAAARMTREEHNTLTQSITTIAQRCKRTDELEEEIKAFVKTEKKE